MIHLAAIRAIARPPIGRATARRPVGLAFATLGFLVPEQILRKQESRSTEVRQGRLATPGVARPVGGRAIVRLAVR